MRSLGRITVWQAIACMLGTQEDKEHETSPARLTDLAPERAEARPRLPIRAGTKYLGKVGHAFVQS
jgi:hypothetical protein